MCEWQKCETIDLVSDLGAEYTPDEARLIRIFDRLTTNVRGIIMTSAESAAEGVVTQLGKAKGEISGLLDSLNAQIESLRTQSVTPETIQALEDVAQGLDDFVADPQPEPTPEPAPEPAPQEPPA